MMKVKMIRNSSIELLERDINEFFNKIGRDVTVKTELIDVKLTPTGHDFVAMIIYNMTAVKY